MHEQTRRVIDSELGNRCDVCSPRVAEGALTGLAKSLLRVVLVEESLTELRALRSFARWKEEHCPIQVRHVNDDSILKPIPAVALARNEYLATYFRECPAARPHETVIRYWLDKVRPSEIDFYTPEKQPI